MPGSVAKVRNLYEGCRNVNVLRPLQVGPDIEDLVFTFENKMEKKSQKLHGLKGLAEGAASNVRRNTTCVIKQ